MPRLKLVPWEPTWLEHSTLDLKAVYRRPQRDRQTWAMLRDEYGFVQWDLTTPITIRTHNKLRLKGFEYVTLADVASVQQAANPAILEKGAQPLGSMARCAILGIDDERPEDYLRQPSGIRGPWNAQAYLADLADEHAARVARLEENVRTMGPDAAELFERQTDREYVLPARYRAPQAAGEEPKRKRGRPRKVEAEAVQEAVGA